MKTGKRGAARASRTAGRTGSSRPRTNRPLNGKEFLESIRDGREVWIYGRRVKDVTTHPAFRNAARTLARMYDALHDPARQALLTTATDTGSGGYTHRFYRVDRNGEELLATRAAIAGWARISYGWMGRSPDYKASFLGTLGANSEYYAPYQQNARRWYDRAQEACLFMNHALVNPPIDRNLPPDQVADVFVRVEKETDAGVVVSGAKVVATGSALTHNNFVGFYGPTPLGREDMAIFAMIPMAARGLKLICRTSYELAAATVGSPFDYPLSSRFDENDAILVLDQVLIPWENVFIYRNVDKANRFLASSGWAPRLCLHGCTRLAIKLDFIVGAFLAAADATGHKDIRSSQAQMGEAVAWRDVFWALSDAMARNPEPWRDEYVLPNSAYAAAYRTLAPLVYPRIKLLIERTLSSALIYLNSHSADFKNPELRRYLNRYIRGSNGYDSVSRVKLLKLMWDAIGSEFGSRHELYEINYGGNHEAIRVENLMACIESGRAQEMKDFVAQCMNDYDLDGWKVADLINPDDVSRILAQAKSSRRA
jgi:aromatic ring hydroxylase